MFCGTIIPSSLTSMRTHLAPAPIFLHSPPLFSHKAQGSRPPLREISRIIHISSKLNSGTPATCHIILVSPGWQRGSCLGISVYIRVPCTSSRPAHWLLSNSLPQQLVHCSTPHSRHLPITGRNHIAWKAAKVFLLRN